MSYTKMKFLFAALLIFVVTASSAFGQSYSSMRFFSPYQRDTFGGGNRSPQGVFGNISYIYRTIEGPSSTAIGNAEWAADINNRVFTSRSSSTPAYNSLSTSAFSNEFASGITAEFGNIVGHHGWFVSGTSLMGIKSTVEGRNASIAIADSLTNRAFAFVGTDYFWNEVWDPTGSHLAETPDIRIINGQGLGNVGYLWGWFPYEGADGNARASLLPLPVTFDKYSITNKTNHWSIDVNCMYRFHRTWLGQFEVFAGPRFIQLDDSFKFSGTGSPWQGVYETWETVEQDEEDGTPPWVVEYDKYLTGTATGPGSVLGNSWWTQTANNRILAPQFGIKYTRQNGRWSFSADTRFLCGINFQSLKIDGQVGSYMDQYSSIDGFPTESDVSFDTDPPLGASLPWTPTGITQYNSKFHHSKSRTQFSPGIECKLDANWQWTNAVGVQFGFDLLWMDNVARGSRINSYAIDENGVLFGINKSKNLEDIFSYGFRVGITINRF